MRFVWLAAALVALASSPAGAQDGDITTNTSIAPIFVHGELQGCSFVFDVAHRDFQYRQGDLVQLSGSVIYNVWPQRQPTVSVKLGVHPLRSTDGTYIAPAEVYIVDGNQTNKAEKLVDVAGETEGFRIFAFRADGGTLERLVEIGAKARLQIGYAMKPGGMLSLVNIEPRMKRLNLDDPPKSQWDDRAPQRWLQCLHDATRVGRERLKQK